MKHWGNIYLLDFVIIVRAKSLQNYILIGRFQLVEIHMLIFQ